MSEKVKPVQITISGGIWNPNSPESIQEGGPLGTYMMPSKTVTRKGLPHSQQTFFHLLPDGGVKIYTAISPTDSELILSENYSKPIILGQGQLIEFTDPETQVITHELKITL